ncbi:MAG: carboxypeptidase-like regulatory domain-containing protein [Bacteroidetes bacterium]|nr:carboxypeptidase-like regulatory domain-containing protein [Bacteroidota bacterium]
MNKRFYLPILLLAFFMMADHPLSAQVHYRFFYGKIFIAEPKTPLPDVNITFEGSAKGSVSDQKGAFSFYIDTIPVFMKVSHIGYKTKRILLDGSSNSMVLYMEPEVKELKEVEIKANKIEAYFKDEHYNLKDYEIDSSLIYLLIYRNKVSREELICRNQEGDTVARSGLLGFTPDGLLKDCLGNLHIRGKDSVYQVYRDGKELKLLYPVGIERYQKILGNCMASTVAFLFYKKVSEYGQKVMYYGVDRTTREKRVISQVEDEEKARMLRRNPEDQLMMMIDPPDAGGNVINAERGETDVSSGQIQGSREAFNRWSFDKKILYRPMKTALYRIRNFICIFNIPGKQLEFYDTEGNFSYKLKLNIDVIRDGRWSGEIYLDEAQSQVYTTFLKSTGTGLYRIDLNNGTLHKRVSLIHPYPQKIKIYNDQIYYMYDILGDPDNRTLYRQWL